MLPVIDPREDHDEQARRMGAACEQTGFFALPFDALDRSRADRAWRAAERFFALPESEKRAVAFPEPGYPYGYSPYRHETLAASLGDEAAPPDLKESLSVGPDCGTHVLDPDLWVNSPSLWPAAVPELVAAWTDHYRELASVAEVMMSIMARALDLPPTYFEPFIDRPITSMRALHYPELGPEPTDALRAGAHTDYGTFTILRTDDVAGLQIRTDDTWVDVKAPPDTLVVNLGDSIAQWTNDRWRSTLHRVTTADPRSRQSFAFFHMANWDATIECLPTCLAPGETPKYPPVEAGPWLMQKFQSTV